jgi:hypothetical protein
MRFKLWNSRINWIELQGYFRIVLPSCCVNVELPLVMCLFKNKLMNQAIVSVADLVLYLVQLACLLVIWLL